jgi:hypothetical protein
LDAHGFRLGAFGTAEEIAMSPYMQKQAGVYYKYRKWEGEGIDPRFKRHDYKYTGNN